MISAYFIDTIALLNLEYLKNPCKVIAFVNDENEAKERFSYILNDDNIEFLKCDEGKFFTIPKNIDYIIHADTKHFIDCYIENPIETINYNLNSIKIILEYSIKNKLQGMLYFSNTDIEKLEKGSKEKIETNGNCISKEKLYMETKKFCEMIFLTYIRQYEIPGNIVRPFNVFGPSIKLDDKYEITRFIKKGLIKENIKLFDEGKDISSFTYITDAHIGFWKVIFSSFKGQIFNIGSDNSEISTKELVKMICELFSNTIGYSYCTDVLYLKDKPKRNCVDINKAKTMLGYEPKENIKQWLKRIIRFYK